MSEIAEIVIGLEDESGETMPVEIDDADENIPTHVEPEDKERKQKRRISITDRILKNKIQTYQESANIRRKELVQLLSEHAEIVQKVTSLVPSSSHDSEQGNKENSSDEEKDGYHVMNKENV